MKPKPRDLVRHRAEHRGHPLKVLKPGDEGYDKILYYAISRPLRNLVGVKLEQTPPPELENMIQGLGKEIRRRKGG